MRQALACLLAGALVLGAAPGAGAGTDKPAGKRCVAAEEAVIHLAGSDEGPPKFTAAFYRHMYSLDVSLDGADGKDLPISIETVCDVPKSLRKQAAQLAGSDGVARVLQRTQIWQDGTQLTGDDASTALDGADTATVRVRMIKRPKWSKDEDGEPLPTFRAGRIEITD
jgi:hypothetical protein